MAYATVPRVKDYLPQLTGSEHDALLGLILDRATRLVDDALGFSFSAYGATATERDVNSGNGGDYLLLPAHKSGSLASVYLVTDRGRGQRGRHHRGGRLHGRRAVATVAGSQVAAADVVQVHGDLGTGRGA